MYLQAQNHESSFPSLQYGVSMKKNKKKLTLNEKLDQILENQKKILGEEKKIEKLEEENPKRNTKALKELHKKLKIYNVSGGCVVSKERGYELKLSRHDSLALYGIMYNNVQTGVFLKRKKSIFERAFGKLSYMRA